MTNVIKAYRMNEIINNAYALSSHVALNAHNASSDEEIAMFEELLHSNAHLLYKYAENGGIQIA